MSRFTHGWVKLHRSLADKDIVQNPFLLSLWVYLLLIANYKESQIIWEGKQRILQPGQCLMKLRELSKKWDCSPTTIWKWLHYLVESERISLEPRTHGTVITIRNWNEYQLIEDEVRTRSEHGANTERTPSEHEVDYSKESKKVRSKEGKKKTPGILPDYPAEFEEVWTLYERKGDKKASYKVFKSLGLLNGNFEKLKAAIRSYVHVKPEKQYRKDFERFLQMDWTQFLELKKTIQIKTFDQMKEDGVL